MYTKIRSVQILISLMKKYGVRYCVISPGTCGLPVTHSLEMDEDFTCYSIVDERNAAYFAMGLAQQVKETVAICCTSGTAAANYFPAINEAFFQNVPLLVITTDRNQYYEFQLADQKIPQDNMYQKVVAKSVTLPIIKDSLDEWYCERCINETLMAINQYEPKPVHINIPIEPGEDVDFSAEYLPEAKKIERIKLDKWNAKDVRTCLANDLYGKRVLVILGQNQRLSAQEKVDIAMFGEKFNCVFSTEHIANFSGKWSVNTYLLCASINEEEFEELAPDIVISVGGQYISGIRTRLGTCKKEYEHWCVNSKGMVVDHLKKLTRVIEAGKQEFFSIMSLAETKNENHEYYEACHEKMKRLPAPQFEYSNNYALEKILSNIPDNSIVHLGIDSIVRMASCLPINETACVYSNRGTTGIDGAVSTFMGQAATHPDLSFLLVGDLSFFYNMNGIWCNKIDSKIRIMLSNNGGGETFYWGPAKILENKDPFVGATHAITAKGWAEDVGFRYLGIHNKEEFDACLPVFLSGDSEQPIFMELFTDKKQDAEEMLRYFQQCKIAVNQWKEKLEDGNRCYVFGTGRQAEYVTKCIELIGGEVVGYCDSNVAKEGTVFAGKEIIYTPNLVNYTKNFDRIVISSEKYYRSMEKMLKELGFSEKDYFLIS